MQHIHHRDDLIGHPQQHADVVAVDQLLEVIVHIELFHLIRRLGHHPRQGDHFEQGADLIREHQRHIAVCLAANPHNDTDILGISRGGLHFQFIIRTIDKVACSLDPDGHYSVFLFHCCGLLRQCGGGEHRCCCCAEHECRCQHKGYQSFGLHRIRPPVFQRITQPYPPARCIGNRHDVMPCYTPILPQNAVSVNNWIQVIQMFYIFAQKRACLRSRPSRLVIHR